MSGSYVQDDGVGQQLPGRGHRRGAVAGRADLPALVAQGAGEDLGEVRVVVDDEDPQRGAVGAGEGGAAGACGVHDLSRITPGRGGGGPGKL
ncbi:hypothetical protein QFZ22_008047 [Streptomyces canus]|uniref:Uncharacterized protein n=1 Tax=Streptomyces canus TaxID=58343 RepID=A0AAW8FPM1_9ACTN|nr:hypothetical protein [Streptomyces canus]